MLTKFQLLTLYLLMAKLLFALQVIHNNPNVFYYNQTTTNLIENQMINFDDDEDDDVEIVFENEKQRTSTTTLVSSLKTRPPILKIYSENVTLRIGQMAILKCGNQGSEISLDEYFKIKSIIWTQEFSPPRLLANNDDLFIKNERFSLIQSSFVQTENFQNKYFSNIYKKPKYFDLKICPAKITDSGWYSCYVVKKSWYDQNVKYYTYLDVVDNISTDDNYSDYQFYNSQSDDEEVCSSEPEITVGEPTPASLLNKVITSEKFKELNDNNKITTIDKYQDTVTAPTDLLEEIEKNLTLKRQIDPPTLNLSDDIQLSDEKLNEKIIIEEIKKGYSSNSTTLSSKHKFSKEKLNVFPKYLNTTQYNSFQFDCIYTGPNYLSIKLIWLKDSLVLDNKEKRIFTLDYKQQNNTRISILKFVYSLQEDSGVYKCVTSRKTSHHLSDSFNLLIQSSGTKTKSMNNFFKIPFFVDNFYLNGTRHSLCGKIFILLMQFVTIMNFLN